MRYLLDTDICIYYLNNRFPGIKAKLERLPPADVGIPAIVKGELLLGAQKSVQRSKVLETLVPFLSAFPIIPFGDGETDFYARIRAELESGGTPIGPNDQIIAATAMSTGTTLVTHNTREFSKVPGLAIEDWTV